MSAVSPSDTWRLHATWAHHLLRHPDVSWHESDPPWDEVDAPDDPTLARLASFGVLTTPRNEQLAERWREAQAEGDSQRKGRLLEETIKLLWTTIPGFTHARTNVGNETEEIDVIVTNRSTDELLRRQGDFIVVECKNWTGRVGTGVVSRLREKVAKRYGRSKLGLCVSMNGFADTVHTDALAERRGDVLVVLLDGGDIAAWIAAADRTAWLVDKIGDAVC